MSHVRSLIRATATSLLFCFGLAITGCGSADPATSCKDLCTGAGYTGSNVDVQPHEINCFCTGGTGTVSTDACMSHCKSIGKSSAQTFKSGGTAVNSCQCS